MTMDSFYTQYLSIVHSADNLLSRPAIIKSEAKCAVQDVEVYCFHLTSCLSALQQYPSLIDSLFGLIVKNGMTGHLGEFIIDNAIRKCNEFSSLESEIQSEIDRVIEARSGSDTNILNGISEKAKGWHRIVSIDNLHYVGEASKYFLASTLSSNIRFPLNLNHSPLLKAHISTLLFFSICLKTSFDLPV